jgi:integrase
VVAVSEGIRRLHDAPPEQAAPLMPPELFAVLDACPQVRHWKTKGRQPEPDVAGLRDRALLLVGFVGALRRSELVALDLDAVADHPNGVVVTLPRSKTNQTGEKAELVVLPRGGDPRRCTVTAVRNWTEAAGIGGGPLLRPVSKGNRALTRRLNPDSANLLVQQAKRRYPTLVLTSGARTTMPEECSFRPVSRERCGRPRSRLVRQRLRRCPRDDLRDDRCRVRGRESFVSSPSRKRRFPRCLS